MALPNSFRAQGHAFRIHGHRSNTRLHCPTAAASDEAPTTRMVVDT